MKKLIGLLMLVNVAQAHASSADAFVQKFIIDSYLAMAGSFPVADLCQIVERDVKLEGPGGLVTNAILPGNWQKASELERKDFASAAKSYMINQLAQTFRQYSGNPNDIKYELMGAEVKAIVPGMEATTVTVQQQADGQWRIIDAMYQGMSVLRAQQEVIRGSVSKNGIAKVTQMMNKKSKELMGVCP